MVTFGGGALDRAAELRQGARALERGSDAEFLLFWKGKPMHDNGVLVRVGPDHPVLADSSPDRIFLGRSEGHLVFAADLSGWTPTTADDATFDSFLDTSEQHHPALGPDGSRCF